MNAYAIRYISAYSRSALQNEQTLRNNQNDPRMPNEKLLPGISTES